MIIDANIGLKWVLDQADSEKAGALADRGDLSVPSHFYFEIATVLTRLSRQKVIARTLVRPSLETIRAVAMRVFPFEQVLDEAVALSLRLHAATSDCLYLALALAEDEVLVTADVRFKNAVSRDPDLAGRVRLLREV